MENTLKQKTLNDIDALELLIKESKKLGASDIDAIISKSTGLSVSIRNGKEETK